MQRNYSEYSNERVSLGRTSITLLTTYCVPLCTQTYTTTWIFSSFQPSVREKRNSSVKISPGMASCSNPIYFFLLWL